MKTIKIDFASNDRFHKHMRNIGIHKIELRKDNVWLYQDNGTFEVSYAYFSTLK